MRKTLDEQVDKVDALEVYVLKTDRKKTALEEIHEKMGIMEGERMSDVARITQ